jgi:hypothetical protein
MPRVTWLLPVKNGMPYLTETLASIEAQTYRNWQVLAWDNGSTDGSLEELHRWIPGRLPGRIVTDRPLPLGAALRCMVEQCDTELCARIDADDVNLPDRLAKQVGFLLAHPHISLVGSQILEIDEDGAPRTPTIGRLPTEDDEIVRDMLRTPGIAHPTVVFRRSAVLAAGNYRYVGEVNVEDYDLWLRLAARHRVANLDVPLLRYRVHERSATVISQRQGLMEQATFSRFVEHAPALFGCSQAEAQRLVTRTHPFAILALVRIARHLKKRSGASMVSTLRSHRFRLAAHRFIGAQHMGDAVSHLVLSLCDVAPGSFRREVGILLRAVLRRFAVGAWLIQRPW